jgi:hypothetical protein
MTFEHYTDRVSNRDCIEIFNMGATSRDAEIVKLRQQVTFLWDALNDLSSCMQGVIEGDYTPDSFTLQPANMALEATRPKEN